MRSWCLQSLQLASALVVVSAWVSCAAMVGEADEALNGGAGAGVGPGCGETASVDGGEIDAGGLTQSDGGPPSADAGTHDAGDVGTDGGAVDGDAGVVADGGVDAGASAVPAAVACQFGFFNKYFERDNGTARRALAVDSFTRIAERVDGLNACGANVTLGGLLSLMIYEGGGAKVAFFNDRCSENSYNSSSTCWQTPKARYSYQYGLAPIHTSNFHPCADVGWTGKMRARLHNAMADAGFVPTAQEVASVAAQLHTFCPQATPAPADFYILSAHSTFAVPTNTVGNDLANAGVYPFFTPRVMIDLFFDALSASCSSLTSDRQAIIVFGGADQSYRTAVKQDAILKLWSDYRAANCP